MNPRTATSKKSNLPPHQRGRQGSAARGNGRNVILDAAVDNFQRLGYHGTSMRDIARDAELTVATIYHHFASKQEILQDIMVQILSDSISLTRTALLQAESDARAQLKAVIYAWAKFHATRQAEALIGASEIRSLDTQGRKLVVALRDEQEHVFRDIVDAGVAQGIFATPYPYEAVRSIVSSGRSIASWYRADGELTPDEIADRYATLALATVEARSL